MKAVELRSLVAQAWESLKLVEELVEAGVPSSLHEAALRWHLYSLHQNILDAIASLLAEAGFRKPAAYSELAAPLLERGYVPSWFAEGVARVAKTRNLLAHAYRRVSREELVSIARKAQAAAPKLLETIAKLAEELGVDPSPGDALDAAEVFRHRPGIIAAVLFGSRARGSSTPDSDYDIAILAERPLTMEELEEVALSLARASRGSSRQGRRCGPASSAERAPLQGAARREAALHLRPGAVQEVGQGDLHQST